MTSLSLVKAVTPLAHVRDICWPEGWACAYDLARKRVFAECAVFTWVFSLNIYYDDAERRGSRKTDAHRGSLQCCIVGKVIGPMRFPAKNIRLPPPVILDYFWKTLNFCTKDSWNLTGNVHCTSNDFILKNVCLLFKLFKRNKVEAVLSTLAGKEADAEALEKI